MIDELYIQPGSSITINRDAGTNVDIRVFRVDPAPTPVEFWYADFGNGDNGSIISSQWYETFYDAVGAGDTQVWCGVDTNEGLVEIFVYNIVVPDPDLIVSNITVDGTVSTRDYVEGETVDIDCIVWNQGAGNAGSSRLGYYRGTSPTDTSNRWGYDSVSSLASAPPTTGSPETELYTFTASDVGSNRYFVFKADYQDVVEEGSAEGNNLAHFGPFRVLPAPHPPVATRDSPVTPFDLMEGEAANLVASATDANGDITGWSFVVDGVTEHSASIAATGSTTQSRSRVFPSAGTYQTELIFRDAGGRTGKVVWTVNVAAQGQGLPLTIGVLVVDGDSIAEVGLDRYVVSGATTINTVIEVGSDIECDLQQSTVAFSGSASLPGNPQKWQGLFSGSVVVDATDG
ncbi:MAG: CARDB domain-containing protein, partial [Planctomycetota bacterium]